MHNSKQMCFIMARGMNEISFPNDGLIHSFNSIQPNVVGKENHACIRQNNDMIDKDSVMNLK